MSNISGVLYRGGDLFQGVLTRANDGLKNILRVVTRNIPAGNFSNLERDLKLFQDRSGYQNPTETHGGMNFIKQGLLNNTGTYIKNCELPMNTFQGIMEEFLLKFYDPLYAETFTKRELPVLFEALLRFAMNQSLNQAQHDDKNGSFKNLQFSKEAMEKAALRAESNEKSFNFWLKFIQSEHCVPNLDAFRWNSEFIGFVTYGENAKDLAYALLAQIYPPENKNDNKIFSRGSDYWDIEMNNLVRGLNNLRFALQVEKEPKKS